MSELTLWAAPISPTGPLHSPPGAPPDWLSGPEKAEWATFVTRKRADEYRTGRSPLRRALAERRYPLSSVVVTRDRYGVPIIEGVCEPPSFSICHCGGFAHHWWALVLVGPPALRIGMDAEPLSTRLSPAVLRYMAAPEEREALQQAGPFSWLRAWVLKECVQKALGLGMHLKPWLIDTRRLPIRIAQHSIDVRVRCQWGLLIAAGILRPL